MLLGLTEYLQAKIGFHVKKRERCLHLFWGSMLSFWKTVSLWDLTTRIPTFIFSNLLKAETEHSPLTETETMKFKVN